jgi:hypothetical protein
MAVSADSSRSSSSGGLLYRAMYSRSSGSVCSAFIITKPHPRSHLSPAWKACMVVARKIPVRWAVTGLVSQQGVEFALHALRSRSAPSLPRQMRATVSRNLSGSWRFALRRVILGKSPTLTVACGMGPGERGCGHGRVRGIFRGSRVKVNRSATGRPRAVIGVSAGADGWHG